MPFDLQPTLRGRLIEVRPLQLDDFDALFEAAGDPLIWEQHPESDRYTREVFQRYFDGAMASKGGLAIVDLESGRVIGSSRYWDYSEERGDIEIGWTFLERAYWGGVYNRELKSLMLDHAFRFVPRVLFRVGEENLRSQKALEKIGAYLLRVETQSPTANKLVFAIDR
jgi:RimJ/RimL family protein N-acetyltransferase